MIATSGTGSSARRRQPPSATDRFPSRRLPGILRAGGSLKPKWNQIHMKFGLEQRDIAYINSALAQFPEIEETVIFGSRAMGNHKSGSDVDLAIKGEKLSRRTLLRLSSLLEEELPIPYYFDLVDYNKIHSPQLLKHIERVGQVFYRKERVS